ncbi:NUDIX hydrolase [Sulfitobacter sp.]|jgi:8-oxo-dGTP diphosphatase|uniref:NUDIX hydrolase n=1 Tax=Sulfitobacter sp. TaxID=1903071 RepID=UPI0019F7D6BE|nr:NUDIX domain-containing protein [Sulfitobacter sp.]
MMRRFGAPPLAGKNYTIRPGAYAILPLKNRFLMTAQMSPQVDVQLPGGGIDPGESPLQTLHREVMEEIGWSIAYPRRLGAFRRFVYMPEYDLWAEKLCHVYVAHPIRQIADPIEPDHTTVVLSADESLAVLGNDGDRSFLQQYCANAL